MEREIVSQIEFRKRIGFEFVSGLVCHSMIGQMIATE